MGLCQKKEVSEWPSFACEPILSRRGFSFPILQLFKDQEKVVQSCIQWRKKLINCDLSQSGCWKCKITFLVFYPIYKENTIRQFGMTTAMMDSLPPASPVHTAEMKMQQQQGFIHIHMMSSK